jgi:indolepyruvate ferredoxin oxidoreductase
MPIGRDVTLDDRYQLADGTVLMTGVQGLVRLLFDQMRADRVAGLRTGTFMSGYQGSPLGGLDRELRSQPALVADLDIHFRPGLNEDLGATSVWGSQLATTLPNPRVEGVLGVWYGKAPGVDRAGDALRHGNFIGAHPKGGLLAICGDDPSCKSSTLPSESESTLAALRMPVVAPGNPQEVLDLGRHAIAASRASGLWVGLKVITAVADGIASVEVGPGRVVPVPVSVDDGGRPYVHQPNAELIAPSMLEAERTMLGPRMALARAYARENKLNTITLEPPRARVGILASGATYYDLREALHTLGLTDDDLRHLGIRLIKIGMLWPLEPEFVRTAARGLEELIVVEDKGPFLETAVRDILFNLAERPRVLGKEDGAGAQLLPANGALDVDVIASAVGGRLLAHGAIASVSAHLEALELAEPVGVAGNSPRLPYFCSGCPHNRSTEVPDGSIVGAGIGCHGMVVINPEGKGTVTGATQMGGEGAQWIGQQPFTGTKHIFQNVGDGTFHHSASLALRASVAAGVDVTYKLLYNSTVAMTGGQDIEGGMAVPELTRLLEAEGVRRIVVTTEDTDRYRGVSLAAIASVQPRSALIAVQEELASEPGVTVLIHDQGCAAEKRRMRKRGTEPDPAERIFINQRVCEGCGDCGQKSHCLSLVPADTEFGRKTQIDQSSCNKDYSCLLGDCPSFLTIIPGKGKPRLSRDPLPADLPEPDALPAAANLVMVGIGGTGVVTTNQVLATAALISGLDARALDQTGLSQKAGAVVSHLRLTPSSTSLPGLVPAGTADVFLAFDALAAGTESNLSRCADDRTMAVVSTSEVPTGRMVIDPGAVYPGRDDVVGKIAGRTKSVHVIDALDLAERLYGNTSAANFLVVGAAYQLGLLPLTAVAIERAIELNGVGVATTIQAFRAGRKAVLDPTWLSAPAAVPAGMVDVRVLELTSYQNAAYAKRYTDLVSTVEFAEKALGLPGTLTEAVARNLFKLMAYKDEYEVARLHLDPALRASVEEKFGVGAVIGYQLHPPFLRALGMRRKITLKRSAVPMFTVLRALRGLRGTAFDPFGRARLRKVERALVEEYSLMVRRIVGELTADRYDVACELAGLPDLVRGYEEIKLASVERYRARMSELMDRFDQQPEPIQLPRTANSLS